MNGEMDSATTPVPSLATTLSDMKSKPDRMTGYHQMYLKLKLPTFNGDSFEWDRFYTLFESKLKDVTYLNDSQKSAHLELLSHCILEMGQGF